VPGDRDSLPIMRASTIDRGRENPRSIAKLAPNDQENLIWIKNDAACCAASRRRAFNETRLDDVVHFAVRENAT
jgi:hypothetical protein